VFVLDDAPRKPTGIEQIGVERDDARNRGRGGATADDDGDLVRDDAPGEGADLESVPDRRVLACGAAVEGVPAAGRVSRRGRRRTERRRRAEKREHLYRAAVPPHRLVGGRSGKNIADGPKENAG